MGGHPACNVAKLVFHYSSEILMSREKQRLLSILEDKSALIGIVGIGYVGLPLAICFVRSGYRVIAFDVDEKKVTSLNSGVSYIKHVESSHIMKAVKGGLLTATSESSRLHAADAIIICVPTPLTVHREPDMQFICNTMEILEPHLREGQVLSLESTTYPGTTEEVLLPHIQKRGLDVGNDFFLVYSPEREDPGNADYKTKDIPKVIGGYSLDCLQVGLALYKEAITSLVPVSSLRVAEMTKLLENIHRSVNIGLMNELKPLAYKMGIDIYEVIRAASTKPFGYTPYYPGPGLGGHCIPIDPFYLTWKAKEYGLSTRFIELAGEINTAMPEYVVSRATDALNLNGLSVKGSKILILGVAYKKNVDDVRESPALEIISILLSKGALVEFSDPYIDNLPKTRRYDLNCKSVEFRASTLEGYDAVLLITDHDSFDYELLVNSAKLIIDTRGRLDKALNIVGA